MIRPFAPLVIALSLAVPSAFAQTAAPTVALPVPVPAPAPAVPAPAKKAGTMVVNFLGPVTSASMAEIVSAAQEAVIVGAEELRISISSGGGSVNAARFAVNALRSMPIKVTTVAMSDVGSSAVALFCIGEERSIAPGASIYLHQLTRFAERSVKTAAAAEREDQIVRGWYDSMLLGCISDPSSMAEIEEYNTRDVILDGPDARRLGMANAEFGALRSRRLFGRAVNVVPAALKPLE